MCDTPSLSGDPTPSNLPGDPDYIDERVFLDAEQETPPRASCTTLMSWLYRVIRPNRL